MKNVLITGTSSGIGAIIAQHLTEKGFNIIGTSRRGGGINDSFKTLQLDKLVHKIIQKPQKPKVRYVVGKTD